MKDGRAVILILRSIKQKGLQESTDEKIFQVLLNTERGEATEKKAEELIKIIDDPKNTEEELLLILEKMEKR